MTDLVRLNESCLRALKFLTRNMATCKLLHRDFLQVNEHQLEELRRMAFRNVVALFFEFLHKGNACVHCLRHRVKNWEIKVSLILALILAFPEN